MSKLTVFEREVLEMVAGTREATWGAWVGACLGSLKEQKLITGYIGVKPRLTEAGRAALAQPKEGQAAAQPAGDGE